jgi:maltooligosyltrehalose trehalohydrolase
MGRRVLVIAESDENDAKLVRPRSQHGYGLDAQWSDDFHHAVHALFTGERQSYYQDFGRADQITQALEQGFVFQGEYFRFWQRARGTSAAGVPLSQHVICLQNHDQVGNRAQGERLISLISRGASKAAAALLLLAPETPLLFMGEEYGERHPFLYFTSYSDPQLARAVSDGRKREFAHFAGAKIPDPQDPATFARSELDWSSATDNNEMLRWYRALIALRKRHLLDGARTCRAELVNGSAIKLLVPAQGSALMVLSALASNAVLPDPEADWRLELESHEDGYPVRVYLRSTTGNLL